MSADLKEDVSVYDFISAIRSRKRLILWVAAVFTVLAGLYGVVRQPVYRISMVIEPPVILIDDKEVPLDTAENLKAKIDSGAYTQKLVREFGLNRLNKAIFKTSLAARTNVVNVYRDEPKAVSDKTCAMLKKLSDYLAETYAESLELRHNGIAQDMARKNGAVVAMQKDLELKGEKLKLHEGQEKELLALIKDLQANTSKLIVARDETLSNKSAGDNMSMLLYSNTIQQNLSQLSVLNNEISNVRQLQKNVAIDIADAQKNIISLKADIEKLKLEQGFLRNIRLAQSPEVSALPISKSLAFVIAAGIFAGLCVGVFLALFAEFAIGGR